MAVIIPRWKVANPGLLRDPAVTTIIIEHPDRFARFGAEYVAAALAAEHRRMVVVDGAEVDDDLVRDMTESMRSLCARRYGRRSAAHRAARAVEVAVGGQYSTHSGDV